MIDSEPVESLAFLNVKISKLKSLRTKLIFSISKVIFIKFQVFSSAVFVVYCAYFFAQNSIDNFPEYMISFSASAGFILCNLVTLLGVSIYEVLISGRVNKSLSKKFLHVNLFNGVALKKISAEFYYKDSISNKFAFALINNEIKEAKEAANLIVNTNTTDYIPSK